MFQPDSAGYVALILTGLKEHERVINRLLTRDQYLAAIEARNSQDTEKGTPQNTQTKDGVDSAVPERHVKSSFNDNVASEMKDSDVNESNSVNSDILTKNSSDKQVNTNTKKESDMIDSKSSTLETEDTYEEPDKKKARIEQDIV